MYVSREGGMGGTEAGSSIALGNLGARWADVVR